MFDNRILHDPELDCNFLQAASKSEQQEFRTVVMEVVLATDMKQHFALVAKFRTLITHSHTSAPSGEILNSFAPATESPLQDNQADQMLGPILTEFPCYFMPMVLLVRQHFVKT